MDLESPADNFASKRIYLISIGAMVIGGTESQKHSLSTTTMKRLLLGICWITKDLQIKNKSNNGDIICISEHQVLWGLFELVNSACIIVTNIIDFICHTISPHLVEVEGFGQCFPQFTEYGCPFWDIHEPESFTSEAEWIGLYCRHITVKTETQVNYQGVYHIFFFFRFQSWISALLWIPSYVFRIWNF